MTSKEVIEDRVQGIEVEMEEVVKNEMRSVESIMLYHLESGTWVGTFQRSEGT